jgi:PAS domain S-box-containing protein
LINLPHAEFGAGAIFFIFFEEFPAKKRSCSEGIRLDGNNEIKTSQKRQKKAKKREISCDCARPKSTVRLATCLKKLKHRQHLRLLAESWELMTDAISVADPETGKLLYVNGAWLRLYGYSSGMALGSAVESLVNPKGLSAHLRTKIWKRSLRGHWCGRLLNRDAKGRVFLVDLSTGLVNTADGELIGLLGVGTPLRGSAVTDEKINRLVMHHQETLSRELQILLESALLKDEPNANGDGKGKGKGKGKGHVKGIKCLSQRELQVFGLIGRGMGTVQIARQLKISNYTIQAHRNRIREKLDIRDSASLTFRAYQWSRGQKKNKAPTAKKK